MKAFYSLSQPFDLEPLGLQGSFAIKMLSYRPKFVQQRSTRPRVQGRLIALFMITVVCNFLAVSRAAD